MSKVLYIKANAKPNGYSRTNQVADSFIESYKTLHPEDEVITLDLYEEGINFLSAEDLNTIFGEKTEESKNHPILKYAYQFADADKYVFSTPLWNLGAPAILKAYIDYVSVTGITFEYTAEGPRGLCQGKKAIHITSRGGDYSKEPGASFEMGDRYLRTIMGFFGVLDFTTIAMDGLDVIGNDVDAIMEQAKMQTSDTLNTF